MASFLASTNINAVVSLSDSSIRQSSDRHSVPLRLWTVHMMIDTTLSKTTMNYLVSRWHYW